LNPLFYIAAFALALGILITVHELGHYSVARLCGVKVLRFSIGFGRPLITRRYGSDRTEWVLALFPLGGYVKMLDEREGEVRPWNCIVPSTASRSVADSPSCRLARSRISCLPFCFTGGCSFTVRKNFAPFSQRRRPEHRRQWPA
jgi:hypothetical protein